MEIGIIIFWLFCGIIAGMIGSKKGQGCLSFLVGILFGPFGIIIALLSKGKRRTCPYCKELVNEDAVICKYCRNSFKGASNIQASSKQTFICPHCEGTLPLDIIIIGPNECPECKRMFSVIKDDISGKLRVAIDLRLKCPHCNQSLEASEDMLGMTINCPACQGEVKISNPIPQPQQTKACPFCGEQILAIAIKCKHCGEFLDTHK